MGYVSESVTSAPKTLRSYYNDTSGNLYKEKFFVEQPSFKQQYGYRSTKTDEVLESLPSSVKLGNKRTAEEALIRLTEMTSGGASGSPDAPVHDRIYTQATFTPVEHVFDVLHKSSGNVNEYQNVMGPYNLAKPSFPIADSTVRSEASSLLRSMRPTRPDFDLTRFVGELRDFPRMFSSGNYVPRSTQDIGGAHLNVQFGILPTTSDIQSAADAVLKGNSLVREFAVQAAQRVHRRGSIDFDTITYDSGLQSKTGGGGFSLGVGPVYFHDQTVSTWSSLPRPWFRLTGTVTHSVRVFSTYEWYVGDPDGFVSRLDAYDAAARKILGGGLTLSTVYELTPWSWMLDWFFDIGGLLSYQQDVADSSLVATRSGYVKETKANFAMTPHNRATSTRTTTVRALTSSSLTAKWQERRPGSPYSLSPQWDLNPFRWGIVAALGLTRAPGKAFWSN